MGAVWFASSRRPSATVARWIGKDTFRSIFRRPGPGSVSRRILEFWKSICRRAKIGSNFNGGLSPWKNSPSTIGLRSFRAEPLPAGTGGGSHLLFGGISIDENPFFTRPGWLASILRYWQHHPSLSYLFTGCYVGISSQAPRPDESGNTLLDLELAYRQLENLPAGDSRLQINELLRHLHTDVSGNTHRSETSFDKFWSPPTGYYGLIEFRAIESLPKADWTGAVALLWRALLTYLLKQPFRERVEGFQFRFARQIFLAHASLGGSDGRAQRACPIRVRI